MSIINQMLKDLDTRHKGKEKNPAKGLKASSLSPKQNTLPYTIGACTLIVFAVGYWFFSHKDPQITQPNLLAQKAKIAKIIATAKRIKPTISQITYTEKKGEGALTLRLTHNPRITMNVSKDQRTLTLNAGHNVLKGQLPHPKTHDIVSAIQFLKGKLQIHLAPKVVVQSLNSTHTKPFSVTLTLKSVKPQKAPATLKTQLPKNVKKQLPLSPEIQMSQQLNQRLDEVDTRQKGAILALKNFVNQHANYMPGIHALATYYASHKAFKKANQLLNTALQDHPAHIPLITLKAQIFLAQNKPKSARALLANYSPKVKTHPLFYELMAATEQQLGKNELAAQYYQELISIDSSNGKYWLGYGLSLAQLGKNNAALRAFKQALISEYLNANLKAFVRTQIEQLGA